MLCADWLTPGACSAYSRGNGTASRGASSRGAQKKPIESLAALNAAVRALQLDLGARGRVFVRYSGTESKLRLLVEGPDEGAVGRGIANLAAAARSDLDLVQ